MKTTVNIIPSSTNTVSIQEGTNKIVVTDNSENTSVEVTQQVTSVVQVLTGAQGRRGDQGLAGPSGSSANIDTSSLATTGSNSFNGNQTITGSLIQGLGNIATGENSHAEGDGTQAIGNFSHAEGLGTIAYGGRSHAEGQDTIASGSYSHAEGNQTIALADHQHVQGQYNAVSSVPAAFIVGNGTDSENRSNLIHAAGNEVQITGNTSLASVQENLVLVDGTPSPSHSFDFNSGSIFYLTKQTQNTVWNVINLPTIAEKATTLTFVIEQEDTAFSASAYQFNGTSVSVKWPQGIVPTGSASTTDAIGLTAFRLGSTWTVLGSLTPFV